MSLDKYLPEKLSMPQCVVANKQRDELCRANLANAQQLTPCLMNTKHLMIFVLVCIVCCAKLRLCDLGRPNWDAMTSERVGLLDQRSKSRLVGRAPLTKSPLRIEDIRIHLTYLNLRSGICCAGQSLPA